eukprot:TRINITY_DN2039_c4_g1_i1.p1 TRINITY_DN2039_c4_g1~~TRINITY_DN2039_c4_g1_i1.p1  ORF type:complete len:590 (+),score=99.76 TRINITY_DN2039_c4_g1_i1:71-1840(+)
MKSVATLLLGLLSTSAAQELEITTTKGKVMGTANNGPNVGFRKWMGIPFAKPPVGDLRWSSPQTPASWNTVLQATKSVGCIQSCGLPFPSCPVVEDEDCLYLNVYAPFDSTSVSNLPVLIWFHGGAFTAGYGGTELYDGSYYSTNQNVIVVTVNYRLGAMGWLASSEFHGNFGFEDQQLAMEWVRDNIASFGGNPQQVTLWGQSAGAGSIAVHLTDSRSEPLFHKVILQSNPFSIPYRDDKTSAELTSLFMSEIGCTETDVACLRGKTSAEVLAAQRSSTSKLQISLTGSGAANFLVNAFLPWTPNVGTAAGKVQNPTEQWLRGKIQDKPIMIGTTRHEGIIYLYGAIRGLLGPNEPMSPSLYTGMLISIFGLEKSLAINTKYPSDASDNRETASQIATEFVFTCSTKKVIYNIAKDCNRKEPIYLFEIDQPMSFSQSVWTSDPECHGKTCHGGDLVFTWAQIYNSLPTITFTADEEKLSADISTAFGTFAKGEVPKLSSGVALSPFQKDNENTLVFSGSSSRNILNYTSDTHSCGFWDTLQEYNQGGFELADTTECDPTPAPSVDSGVRETVSLVNVLVSVLILVIVA